MVVDNAYKLEGGRQRSFTIVDARSKEAYAEAHVMSAISVPEAEFAARADLLPQDRSRLLVVYGDGAELGVAARWAERAIAAGYRNVAVCSEDFRRWKERSMPVAPPRKDS